MIRETRNSDKDNSKYYSVLRIMLGGLKSAFGISRNMKTIEIDQALLNIQSSYDTLLSYEDDHLREKSGIMEKVQQILEYGDRSWESIFYMEQLLASLYSTEGLRMEVSRRLEEARELNLASVNFYEQQFQADDELSTKSDKENDRRTRVLLKSLINDLQKHITLVNVRRSYARRAVKRVSWLFLISFLVFGATLYLSTQPLLIN